MQSHRPENNESMNGKHVPLSLKLRAAQRQHWLFQQAAADLPHCHEDWATPKRCSETPPNTIPTFLTVLASKKTPVRHTKGDSEDGGTTGCAGGMPSGWSILPSTEADLDLQKPLGTELLPKLTAAGYLRVFWTLDPWKARSQMYRQAECPH